MANLLFDLDGTLTDPFDGITRSVQYALEKLGQPVPTQADLSWVIGPPLRRNFARLLDTGDTARIEAAVEAYRERFGTIGLFENAPYDGITTALDTLRGMGHRLFVVTAKPQGYAEQILAHFELTPRFESVSGSAMDGSLDDKAVQIDLLRERFSLDATHCVMIGDRDNDLLAARRAGVKSLAVTWGYGPADELAACDPDGYCVTPRELPAAVTALFA